MSIGSAIVSRWDDAGLDATIANLYRGSPEPSDPFRSYSRPTRKHGATPLDDDDMELPRAEYILGDSERIEDTTSCKISQAMVVFKVWHTDLDTLESLQETIEDQLDNSDRAATNPLSLPSAISMKFIGSEAWIAEDNVCVGVSRFELTYARPNTVPG